MPIVSVTNAEISTNDSTVAIKRLVCTGAPVASFTMRRNCGRTTKIIAAANSNVKTIVVNETAMPLACTSAITSARMHQAVTSSTAAQVSAIDPSGVWDKARSSSIRASTGKAVMLIATPMNNANAVNEVPGGASSRYTNNDNAVPRTNGTT